MSGLKRRLNQVLRTGETLINESKPVRRDFSDVQEMRTKISERLNLSVRDFCRTKADFNYRHGLAYKILRTNQNRLMDSTLCSHDTNAWLRDHQHPVAALWVIKLAGPESGQVSRNVLLQWLRQQGQVDAMRTVHKWTKKWGFKDTDRTHNIIASAQSVSEARELYRSTEFSSKRAKQMFGNRLLKHLITKSSEEPEDIWGFFRMLNKDLVTLQIMLGGMVRKNGLRKYRDELWTLAIKQQAANNLQIDTKLQETYERVKRLPLDLPPSSVA